MVRILHLSDVHVAVPHPAWRPAEWFSKHATGWVNLRLLGRGRAFQFTAELLAQFRSRAREYRPDVIVFSGDATALGFTAEATEAARLLEVGPSTGIAVPGNHDYYTRAAERDRGFESAFAPWMEGNRIDGEIYPFAREVAGVWFIGVNSAVPNRGVWDARGLVGAAQLDRLDRLLSALPPARRVLVTHYPYCTAEGLPEPRHHGLRDRAELLTLVRRHNIEMWLCGHRHRSFQYGPTPEFPLRLVCAGSATHQATAGWWEIEISPTNTEVSRVTAAACRPPG